LMSFDSLDKFTE
jgi:hypothetical protein